LLDSLLQEFSDVALSGCVGLRGDELR